MAMTVVIRICSVVEQCRPPKRQGARCENRLGAVGIPDHDGTASAVPGWRKAQSRGRLDRGRVRPEEGCWVLWTRDRGVDNACESGFDRLGKVPRPGVRSTEAARM